MMISLTLAAIFGVGSYHLLGSRYSEILIGIALISNGINLLLIESGQQEGDPLPQALILTAIVIGFSLLAFLSAYILTRINDNSSDKVEETEEQSL